ncbi:MAG: RCC1 domain-containing protein, partial [Acidimicrobiales bacterium]
SAGGGISWDVPAGERGPWLVSNSFGGNIAAFASALHGSGPQADVLVVNNILSGPVGTTAVECSPIGGAPAFSYNDVFNGGLNPIAGCGTVVGVSGNVSFDPRFASPAAGDLQVALPSPVVDAGNQAVPGLSGTDRLGNTRVVDGDGDGTARVDIGATEAVVDPDPSEAWGRNPVGQIGDGTATDRLVPTPTANSSQMVSVAAGGYHTLGVKADGTAWAWGWNILGQLGDGTTVDRLVPVQVPGLTDVVAVSAGLVHSLALKADGTVWAWGWNGVGVLGDGTTINRATPVQVQGLTGVHSIAAGGYHNLALKVDGTVCAWGWNVLGELGDGTTVDHATPVLVSGLPAVTSVAAGALHSMALVGSSGEVWTWGWNGVGQLGDGTNVTRLSPVKLRGGGISQIAAGAYHSLALEDIQVLAWGWNAVGQLGDGTTTDRWSPVTANANHPRSISAGGYHSLAKDDDGTMYAWGWNGVGQLGDGTITSRLTPSPVPGTADLTLLSAGLVHSAGV